MFFSAKKKCPFCKEKVKSGAIVCKHCKSELLPPPPKLPKKWYQTWIGLLFILMVISMASGLRDKYPPTGADIKPIKTEDAKSKVDEELKKQLGGKPCIKSWEYDETSFKILFSPLNCKPGISSAALITARYCFDSHKATLPQKIIILGTGEYQSYPFSNVPAIDSVTK